MSSEAILYFLSESAYLLIVFIFFLSFTIFKGRQAVINQICGLYLALLITDQFPYYEYILKELNHSSTILFAKIFIFIIVMIICTLLFKRIMPDEYREGKFESMGKKIALALGATILVISFSFNVLPIADLLHTGTPIRALFSPEEYFFWWLLVPLIILVIN